MWSNTNGPVPATARYNALAEIAGSNLTRRGMAVCLLWVLCVVSEELISHTEESCRMWCVVMCNLEISWVKNLLLTWRGGWGVCCAQKLIKMRRKILRKQLNILRSYVWESSAKYYVRQIMSGKVKRRKLQQCLRKRMDKYCYVRQQSEYLIV
jgi:hypothetical protein